MKTEIWGPEIYGISPVKKALDEYIEFQKRVRELTLRSFSIPEVFIEKDVRTCTEVMSGVRHIK